MQKRDIAKLNAVGVSCCGCKNRLTLSFRGIVGTGLVVPPGGTHTNKRNPHHPIIRYLRYRFCFSGGWRLARVTHTKTVVRRAARRPLRRRQRRRRRNNSVTHADQCVCLARSRRLLRSFRRRMKRLCSAEIWCQSQGSPISAVDGSKS